MDTTKDSNSSHGLSSTGSNTPDSLYFESAVATSPDHEGPTSHSIPTFTYGVPSATNPSSPEPSSAGLPTASLLAEETPGTTDRSEGNVTHGAASVTQKRNWYTPNKRNANALWQYFFASDNLSRISQMIDQKGISEAEKALIQQRISSGEDYSPYLFRVVWLGIRGGVARES
ncbi:hypothetical protein PIIN_07477 [Serendipita indica DSM 11827]|uniref:Uncharacterized protein n=1 Tax=Serendipita indica (strain DSM 11827) TaxID=1109443 RepID=G4TQD1_SERID|nr:hypothetical protein PIIN_07477 [Serendipita indica DSM 11827]